MDYVYVDTSAWVSLADSSETHHQRIAETLRNRQGQLVTSDHILHETWMVMRYRHDAYAAETLVNSVRSGIAKIEVSGLADLEVAAAIGSSFADQDFSLSDRTSWAIMERLGIHQAISLDNDFRIYRFGPDRRNSFTVSP